MKNPDFIIAGAARSGTTSLYSFLDSQETIYMAKPMRPEPKFFSRDENFLKGKDWYLQEFFRDCPKEKIAGEKSTEYFESKLFPERVISLFPKIKIVLILRDPVDRAISNYWWSVKNGVEKREISEAFEEELSIKKSLLSTIDGTRPHDYIYRSLYFEKLENIYKYIPSEQILLIDFYDLKAKFAKVVSQLSSFLNVEFQWKDEKELFKNEASRSESLKEDLKKKLVAVFKDDIQKVNQEYNLAIHIRDSASA